MSLISQSLRSIRGVRLTRALCIKHHLWFEVQCLSSNTAELAAENKVMVGGTNISQFWWWWKHIPFNGNKSREVWRCFVGSRCWMSCWDLLGQSGLRSTACISRFIMKYWTQEVAPVCWKSDRTPFILHSTYCGTASKQRNLSLLLLLFLLAANVRDDKNNPIRKNGANLKRLRNVVLRHQYTVSQVDSVCPWIQVVHST